MQIHARPSILCGVHFFMCTSNQHINTSMYSLTRPASTYAGPLILSHVISARIHVHSSLQSCNMFQVKGTTHVNPASNPAIVLLHMHSHTLIYSHVRPIGADTRPFIGMHVQSTHTRVNLLTRMSCPHTYTCIKNLNLTICFRRRASCT